MQLEQFWEWVLQIKQFEPQLHVLFNNISPSRQDMHETDELEQVKQFESQG